MGFGSLGYNQGSQQSESSQGLMPTQRAWFSRRAPGLFGAFTDLANTGMGDPAGLQYEDTVNRMIPIGRYGLPTSATEGTYQVGRDLFSQASASRAGRGFRSPDNLEAVLGDAVRMASGTLIPLSTQFALQRAQIAPALRSAAFGYGRSPIDVLQNLLAGSGASSSSGSGFGFNAAGGYKG